MKYAVGILFLISMLGVAQQSNRENPVLLNPALPSVYLRLDRFDKRAPVHSGESGSIVRLTLHNNTKGAISLCTESLYIGPKVSPLKLWSGKDVLGLREGTETAVCYSLEHQTGSAGAVGEYRVTSGAGGDVSSTSWVPSGHSIVIDVPKEVLDTRSRIRVPFNYEWEPDARDEAHVVFFNNSELPK